MITVIQLGVERLEILGWGGGRRSVLEMRRLGNSNI